MIKEPCECDQYEALPGIWVDIIKDDDLCADCYRELLDNVIKGLI